MMKEEDLPGMPNKKDKDDEEKLNALLDASSTTRPPSGFRRERKTSFERSIYRIQVNASFDNFAKTTTQTLLTLWRRLDLPTRKHKEKTYERLVAAFQDQLEQFHNVEDALRYALASPTLRHISKAIGCLLPRYRRDFVDAIEGWGSVSYRGAMTRKQRLDQMIRLKADLAINSRDLSTPDFVVVSTRATTDFNDFTHSLNSIIANQAEKLSQASRGIRTELKLENRNSSGGQMMMIDGDGSPSSSSAEPGAATSSPSALPPSHWQMQRVCTNCSRPGHVASRCPDVPFCYKCHRSGHIAASCWH